MNEVVKKPSLRSVVAYFLSGKGRHIEFTLFELLKIDIYNSGKPFFLFHLIDMRYS